MGLTTKVTYFLPVTRVHLRCVVTTSKDTVLDSCVQSTSGLAVELVTVADLDRRCTLAVESGLWRDYAFTLGLTEDGRLVQAGVESTGQVGKVLVGATKLTVGLAALAFGNLPLAAVVGVSTLPESSSEATLEGLDTRKFKQSDTPTDLVAAAYLLAHQEASERLAALVHERVTTLGVVDKSRKAYLEASGDAARISARKAYRAAREVLRDVDRELDRSKAHFEAWRKSTVIDTEVVLDLFVGLDALPTFEGGVLSFADGHEGADVRRLFEESGEVLTIAGNVRGAMPSGPIPVAAAGRAPESLSGAAAASLQVRRPRLVELVAVSGDDAADVHVTAVYRELVMDHRCEELELPVRKSWNAKRRIDVQLSEKGALIGVGFNGESSAAAATGVASDVADSLTGSLESAVKGRAAVQSLISAAEDVELAQLKRQVALIEQRLLLAGQAATAQDYAKLERLKQKVEAAALETKLKPNIAHGQLGPK